LFRFILIQTYSFCKGVAPFFAQQGKNTEKFLIRAEGLSFSVFSREPISLLKK